MNEPEFWILALSKKSGSEEIEVVAVSSEYVPEKDEYLQVLSLSRDKNLIKRILVEKPNLKDLWGDRGLIDPKNRCGMCLGSGDLRRIIAEATGNEKIWENEEIICGKGKWRFYVFSDGDGRWF